MYSFDPTEEQQMLIDAVNKYAVNDLRVAAHEAEETCELPKKLVSKGWELQRDRRAIRASPRTRPCAPSR